MGRADEDEAGQIRQFAGHAPAEQAQDEAEETARQPIAAPGNIGPQFRQGHVVKLVGIGRD